MSDENIKENSPVLNGSAGKADTEPEESFASLLEKTSSRSEWLEPGQKVRAKVVSISGELVYIDLGGKSEGIIDLAEFRDKEGSPAVHNGDEIEAYFVSVQDGFRRLTTLVNGYSTVTLGAIRSAYEAGLPVNGEVKREIKGGFEVSLGEVRCFCPLSHIDLKGGRRGGDYKGQTLTFKILAFEEEGRNIVLSRKTLLEEEKQVKLERLKNTLAVGMDINGTVTSVQSFGAFVDLGGIDGLIPASEISWERTDIPSAILSAGQEIKARIISLDWENKRLTLSIKATLPDPWAALAEKYPLDSRVSGTIVRLVPFGAFVRLEPGIDGLIHISNLGAGRRINHPKEVVEAGQWVEAYVFAIDPENRKISLSLQPRPRPEKIVLPEAGEVVSGVVEKVMPFGVFLKMDSGLNGLIPNSEMGTPPNTDHRRMFPAGTEMQAVVTEVDKENSKVRLSRKAVLEKAVQEEYSQYIGSAKQESELSGGLGSIGEILKARMEEKKINN